ncbi:MAG: ABC transporter permease subunit [Gammaproteobacteria bacterium]|nr:ABC transporter permease subunit [Gammaproteobacteria bacterium]
MSIQSIISDTTYFQSRRTRQLISTFLAISVFILSLLLVVQAEDESVFPEAVSSVFTFEEWVNQAEDWMKDNFRWFTRMVAGQIEAVMYLVEDFLIDSPWFLILMLMVLPSLHFGGLPLALLTLFSGLFWGGVGMWEQSMQTLALMGLAVILSVIVGVLLGILSSQSDRFEAWLKPVLDTMQTMPAFVYLLPAVFFFGIGGPPAILATMIYALPPVIRLTNLGIRQIPDHTMEASRAFGATRMQTLFKVQIPISLSSIMLGINQTIMMALGLVILATFIGAGGLGTEVWNSMYKLNVGWSLEAGMCIVFMAIVLDRLSMAMGKSKELSPLANTMPFRLFPQTWDKHNWACQTERAIGFVWNAVSEFCGWIVGLVAKAAMRGLSPFFKEHVCEQVRDFLLCRRFLVGSALFIGGMVLLDKLIPGIGGFPEYINFSFREPIDDAVAWLTVNPSFIAFTKGLRAVVYLGLLDPLNTYLVYLPWHFVMIVLVFASWKLIGGKFAVTCLILMLFIGACGLWTEAMLTLSSVFVSVLICMVIGMPIGVMAAHNPRIDMLIKPILDAMQTMPSFVYLIPVLMFFGGNIVSAVIATVVYAMPPVIRLTTLGLTQIPPAYTEVATSFGSTSMQKLFKIKLPIAMPSIMLGLNQAVMMGLAMQVVTPLIGGVGLGRDVFAALNQANTGYGLAAGMGIVLLAVVLDRLSQAWTRKQEKLLGL